MAIVTGASKGIGASIARHLAAAGASVVVNYASSREGADRVVAAIVGDGGRAIAVQADVSKKAEIDRLFTRTKEEFGRLDVLVNNAGVMLLGPVEGAATEHWRRMVEVNLLGLLYCTHAALPVMREGGGGHIVNLSSTAGRTASQGSAVYNLTKWGVCGFSEGLRQEALQANIRVTIVEPGFVETELQGHNEHPSVVEGMEQMREKIGKVLEPRDIAGAVLFAISQPEHVAVNEILVRPTRQER